VCLRSAQIPPNAAVLVDSCGRLLEQLALAQFGEHSGLTDLNAPAATLCFRFALAAILWVKPGSVSWPAPTDQKGFGCGGGGGGCHIMGYSTARLWFK
jgi:hypothetical protein